MWLYVLTVLTRDCQGLAINMFITWIPLKLIQLQYNSAQGLIKAHTNTLTQLHN